MGSIVNMTCPVRRLPYDPPRGRSIPPANTTAALVSRQSWLRRNAPGTKRDWPCPPPAVFRWFASAIVLIPAIPGRSSSWQRVLQPGAVGVNDSCPRLLREVNRDGARLVQVSPNSDETSPAIDNPFPLEHVRALDSSPVDETWRAPGAHTCIPPTAHSL